MAVADIHILRKQELFYFAGLPLQVLHRRGSHSNQQVEIIEIFVVRKALLQKIAAPNSAVYIIEVHVRVAGILDF